MCRLINMLRSMFGGGEYTPAASQQPSIYPGNIIPTEIHSVANTFSEFVTFMTAIEDDAVSKGFERGIVTAHAGHETGWGRSVIDKNLFNRKKGSWTGNVMRIKTWEYTPQNKVYDYFRAYLTYFEGYLNYISLIQGWSNYAKAWNNRDFPSQYFYWLMNAPQKYATDPTYISKCLNAYNLIKEIV